MKTYIKIIFAGAVLLFVSSIAIGQPVKLLPADPKAKGELFNYISLFAEAIGIIDREYVDKVSPRKLMYGAMRGMLESLDEFSGFLEPDELKEMEDETKGEFGGIGIEISTKDGLLNVIAPMAGTPAEASGIKPGDKIVKIDGKAARGMDMDEASKMLKGKPGTSVVLTIWREKTDKIFDVAITRAVIKVPSIKTARIIEGGIGYIRLAEFQQNTAPDLDQALKRLELEGMNSLILDLRNNPGGLLEAAVAVADRFLPKDAPIVSIKARDPDHDSSFKAGGHIPERSYPLVVLVNDGSASGSEVVAGAIQDNKRGVLAGIKTYGKASVQEVVPMGDGSALRLTTASYLTPSGKVIRGTGIMPDVVIELKDGNGAKIDSSDLFDKPEKEEGKDVIPVMGHTGTGNEPDNQLDAAINLIKAVKAYEGLKS